MGDKGRGGLAKGLGAPGEGALEATHGGDGDGDVVLFFLRDLEDEGGVVVGGEGALDGEGDADGFAGDAEGGGVKTGDAEVGERGVTADGEDVGGDAAGAKVAGGAAGRLAGVPVAVREED